jgi:hypothetical protein
VTDPLRDAIEADPKVAELLAGDPLQAAIIGDLITAYVDNVHAEHDALLGDLDNWKPTGILGASSRTPRPLVNEHDAAILRDAGAREDTFDVSPDVPR